MRGPNYFKIGLFVLGAAAVVVLAVIAFGVGALFEDEVIVETYFTTSVQGLDIGSPVKYRGVQVGQVKEMTVVRQVYKTRHRYVLIRMTLQREAFLGNDDRLTEAKIEREVEQGLRVRLNFQGVTGAAYIEVDYVEPERYPPLEIDWIPRYPYIPAMPSLITRITDAVDGILRHLEKIDFEGIAGNLEGALGSLSHILDQANAGAIGKQAELLLTELRQTNRQLSAKLEELQLQPVLARADATLEQVGELAARTEAPLREFLQASGSAAKNLDQLLAQVNESKDLSAGLNHFRQALTRLDRLLYAQQEEIETTLRNLQQMSENLRAVSEEARDNPSGVLFGAPPPRRPTGGAR